MEMERRNGESDDASEQEVSLSVLEKIKCRIPGLEKTLGSARAFGEEDRKAVVAALRLLRTEKAEMGPFRRSIGATCAMTGKWEKSYQHLSLEELVPDVFANNERETDMTPDMHTDAIPMTVEAEAAIRQMIDDLRIKITFLTRMVDELAAQQPVFAEIADANVRLEKENAVLKKLLKDYGLEHSETSVDPAFDLESVTQSS